MRDLTAADFWQYFLDVHGQEPFPWQQRLTAEVLERGKWPDVIDLPTGAGKTAVLDTALFTLAVDSGIFPRRIVFVIDRRIVVDQVYKRAQQIRCSVEKAGTPVLEAVRDRLRQVGGTSPLGVAALRGGIPIDSEWARRPDEPWVMVSTVDQFGSRLLFRGYGVSRRMRPIHAGLAGSDCLVILDEVHLSGAFAETLQATAGIDSDRSVRLPRRFSVVEMSATPRLGKEGWSFGLASSDLDGSDELRRRVQARKSVILRDAGKSPPHKAVPAAVKRIIKSELDDSVRTVGVIVNRVRTARETHRALAEDPSLQKAGYSVHLVTGRMRPLDRKRQIAKIEQFVNPNRQPGEGELAVVVGTQAIEVGADFSFDALITEVAPIDCLRQRFGRLDRRGSLSRRTSSPAKAWILGVQSVLNPKKPDPVYADAARVTWEALQSLGNGESTALAWPPEAALELSTAAKAPVGQAPMLLPSYMDAWIQTQPEPVVQPEVDWFLHGINTKQTADVAIAWRFDRSAEALRAVPPRPSECLQVPVAAARDWLGGMVETEVADAGGGFETDRRPLKQPTQKEGKKECVRWRGRGRDEGPESIYPRDIRPGDLLVVDPRIGGLSNDNWAPDAINGKVSDLGDEAQHAYRRRVTLRLDPRVLSNLPSPPAPDEEASTERPSRDRILDWLTSLAEEPDLPDWMSEVVLQLRNGRFEISTIHGDGDGESGYYVLTLGSVDPATLDGSDEASSLTGTRVALRDHLQGVGRRALDYARRLGLPEPIQSDLRLAAQLHDLGKVDRRFQQQLVGNDPVLLAMLDEPLAKSVPGAVTKNNEWPPVRHEVMSVALAQSNGEILDQAHDPDLVLHLVGSHHGYGRPLPLIQRDREPETLECEHEGHRMRASTDLLDGPLALEMAERFWRLTRRYGYYGLAWLEAILRLADHQQSAEEEAGQ